MHARAHVKKAVLDRRCAGILLHPTSLPYALHEGALGRHAYHFIDFLTSASQGVWQVLPLNPPHIDHSPYNASSAFAGNRMLVSLEVAAQWGWLEHAPSAGEVNQPTRLQQWLTELGTRFHKRAHEEDRTRYEEFCATHGDWLEDYALYAAVREVQGVPWQHWPAPLRDREPAALRAARAHHASRIKAERVLQFAFFRQWEALREYAHARGVLLFGDIPIFVAPDSADVWAHRKYFRLDARGMPAVEAGCPPDYYTPHGQRWGNPLYDWARMQADEFAWWKRRLEVQLELFDVVRLDHFRGFEACWEIPAEAATAAEGQWVKTPGDALLAALGAQFGRLPLVAEDLGIITPEVHALRQRFGLPGMRVLQFGFDGDPRNIHLPHEHAANAVVYTGTHDNDTTLGWYRSLPHSVRRHVRDYLGGNDADMPWPFIRLALASVCRLAILPMQDVLGLGEGHRMNTPGTHTGNWQWRFEWSQLTPKLVEHLRHLTHLYGRD